MATAVRLGVWFGLSRPAKARPEPSASAAAGTATPTARWRRRARTYRRRTMWTRSGWGSRSAVACVKPRRSNVVRSSSVLMIVLLQVSGVAERLAQLGQGVVGLALDGSGAAAQGAGGLLDREVLEVAQHEHRALAYWQIHHRGQQHLLQQHVRVGCGIAEFDGRGALVRPPEAVTPVVLGEVDHRPAGIRCRLAADPPPPAGYLQQRRLHDVLGVAAIAGEQVGHAQQPRRRIAHELVEVAIQHVHPHARNDTISDEKVASAGQPVACAPGPTVRPRRGTCAVAAAPPATKTASPSL